MYVPIFKLENKPVLQEKVVQGSQKISFLCCFGVFGNPQMDQKGTQRPASRRDVCPNV
jgi:hypothetical protein